MALLLFDLGHNADDIAETIVMNGTVLCGCFYKCFF